MNIRKIGAWRFALLLPLLSAAVLVGASGAWAGAPSSLPSTSAPVQTHDQSALSPVVSQDVKHDVSPAVRDLPVASPYTGVSRQRIPEHSLNKGRANASKQDKDSVVQPFGSIMTIPTPIVSFDGIANANSFCNCYPPDTNGDIGPNHYVEVVNAAFAIYDRNGTQVQASRAINTLFSGFGGQCQTNNDGDPIVVYDRIADRWLISQFTYNGTGPFYECIAVSTTADPTGSYYRYAFLTSNSIFGDYPHFGLWPDAYYMSTNEFAGNNWAGAGNYAFDRTRMLQGLSATSIYFHLPTSDWGGQQPSNYTGGPLPPAGAPNLFVEVDDSAWDPPNIPSDQIQMWRFHADFVTPTNSTFTTLPVLAPAAFDGLLCNFGLCVPQPGTTQKLDTLSDRLMYKVAYRNNGNGGSIVFNHTVDVGTNQAGIRWYEIRNISGTPSIFQQGTYSPTADHYWMGSMAMDGAGDIALGYSISSSTVSPSVRYTGRVPTDPAGTLPQGEGVIINGTGSQLGTVGRWGDYSSLSVDPIDDCTFWYANEYYATTSSTGWKTRIGSFKFPNCTGGGATPTPQPSNTPTVTRTFTPQPTATNTRTPLPTQTPGGATATPVPCTIQFTDVPVGSTFYTFIRCLACRGIISGYPCGGPGEPCDGNNNPYFRPNAWVTRGQIAKIVSNAAGFQEAPGSQIFEDVPPGNAFYPFINRLYNRGVMGGYPCGGTNPETGTPEPCVPPNNRPYFRPANSATRGQFAKIDSNAAGYSDTPTGQTFADVAPGSTFYVWIERLTSRGIISGYACGGTNPETGTPEPCDGFNRPYFRPNNHVSRGQTSKIVANTFFPNCQTP